MNEEGFDALGEIDGFFGPEVAASADVLANAVDADVLFFNADLDYGVDEALINIVRARERLRPNLVLVLVTLGGDPDAAYRIGRCLRQKYKGKITIFVSGACKSSGTLLALVGDEIVMSDYGQLGPIDIQVAKPDDIGTMSSGLTATTALTELRNEAFLTFERTMLEIKRRSFSNVSFRAASEVASNLTVGLFAPIYAQVQALQLGEVGRANRITGAYGRRLASRNVKNEAIDRLIATFPSHTFVIDREEARHYFEVVREPSPEECDLFDLLGDVGLAPMHVQGSPAGMHVHEAIVEYLNTVPKDNEDAAQEQQQQQQPGETSAGADRREREALHDSPGGRPPATAGPEVAVSANGSERTA
ncbi:MAG TPA: hypothetical protein VFB22_14555 [Candidatus Baltobacteraceae bacterium]|nr:hypothetical protein [Candidatus Baltobacteraceae bacterium]